MSASVIVLAYNEAENLGPVLRELLAWSAENAPELEVIVVDDGSSDGSAEIARQVLGERGHVLRHSTNRGMGAGLKTGSRAATREWLTFMPADGQIPPSGIGELLSATDDDIDLVLSCYRDRDDGLARKILSASVRALITVVHGVQLQSEGPYLIRRRLFDPAQLKADTFFLNFEVPIRALAAGLRVAHVSMDCRPRRAGESKTAHPGRALRVGKELVGLRVRRVAEALRRIRG
ncbi:MAG: glycosyltransferase involved in cell wall biosynthesis [Polyangiales bacterium]|jgi:glycosyltransferase involved in cell wall biosynthesis